MVPRSGLSRPAKHRSVVDFPEPDGPNRTVSEKASAGRRSSTWMTGPPGKHFSNSAVNSVAAGAALRGDTSAFLLNVSRCAVLAGTSCTGSRLLAAPSAPAASSWLQDTTIFCPRVGHEWYHFAVPHSTSV